MGVISTAVLAMAEVLTRVRLKVDFTILAENETSAENGISLLAETETKMNISQYFRPKTKTKMKPHVSKQFKQ